MASSERFAQQALSAPALEPPRPPHSPTSPFAGPRHPIHGGIAIVGNPVGDTPAQRSPHTQRAVATAAGAHARAIAAARSTATADEQKGADGSHSEHVEQRVLPREAPGAAPGSPTDSNAGAAVNSGAAGESVQHSSASDDDVRPAREGARTSSASSTGAVVAALTAGDLPARPSTAPSAEIADPRPSLPRRVRVRPSTAGSRGKRRRSRVSITGRREPLGVLERRAAQLARKEASSARAATVALPQTRRGWWSASLRSPAFARAVFRRATGLDLADDGRRGADEPMAGGGGRPTPVSAMPLGGMDCGSSEAVRHTGVVRRALANWWRHVARNARGALMTSVCRRQWMGANIELARLLVPGIDAPTATAVASGDWDAVWDGALDARGREAAHRAAFDASMVQLADAWVVVPVEEAASRADRQAAFLMALLDALPPHAGQVPPPHDALAESIEGAHLRDEAVDAAARARAEARRRRALRKLGAHPALPFTAVATPEGYMAPEDASSMLLAQATLRDDELSDTSAPRRRTSSLDNARLRSASSGWQTPQEFVEDAHALSQAFADDEALRVNDVPSFPHNRASKQSNGDNGAAASEPTAAATISWLPESAASTDVALDTPGRVSALGESWYATGGSASSDMLPTAAARAAAAHAAEEAGQHLGLDAFPATYDSLLAGDETGRRVRAPSRSESVQFGGSTCATPHDGEQTLRVFPVSDTAIAADSQHVVVLPPDSPIRVRGAVAHVRRAQSGRARTTSAHAGQAPPLQRPATADSVLARGHLKVAAAPHGVGGHNPTLVRSASGSTLPIPADLVTTPQRSQHELTRSRRQQQQQEATTVQEQLGDTKQQRTAEPANRSLGTTPRPDNAGDTRRLQLSMVGHRAAVPPPNARRSLRRRPLLTDDPPVGSEAERAEARARSASAAEADLYARPLTSLGSARSLLPRGVVALDDIHGPPPPKGAAAAAIGTISTQVNRIRERDSRQPVDARPHSAPAHRRRPTASRNGINLVGTPDVLSLRQASSGHVFVASAVASHYSEAIGAGRGHGTGMGEPCLRERAGRAAVQPVPAATDTTEVNAAHIEADPVAAATRRAAAVVAARGREARAAQMAAQGTSITHRPTAAPTTGRVLPQRGNAAPGKRKPRVTPAQPGGRVRNQLSQRNGLRTSGATVSSRRRTGLLRPSVAGNRNERMPSAAAPRRPRKSV